MYNEVPSIDFIAAVNNAHIGIFEDTEVFEENGKVVNAKRYFLSAEEVIREMGAEIDDRKLTDFGSLLKGNDLFHEGKISHHNFFQILSKVFDDLIGEGDILDVIKFFDSENLGFIMIRDVQREFNKHIEHRRNHIKLVSWVDACVETHIVEPVSPRNKSSLRKGGGSDSA